MKLPAISAGLPTSSARRPSCSAASRKSAPVRNSAEIRRWVRVRSTGAAPSTPSRAASRSSTSAWARANSDCSMSARARVETADPARRGSPSRSSTSPAWVACSRAGLGIAHAHELLGQVGLEDGSPVLVPAPGEGDLQVPRRLLRGAQRAGAGRGTLQVVHGCVGQLVGVGSARHGVERLEIVLGDDRRRPGRRCRRPPRGAGRPRGGWPCGPAGRACRTRPGARRPGRTGTARARC